MHSSKSDQGHARNDHHSSNPVSVRSRPDSGQLDYLRLENGLFQITVSPGEIPPFIIDANNAVKEGKIEEAAALLNEDAVASIREMESQGKASTALMFALAKLLFDADQLPKAEQWYRKVCEREPHAAVYSTLADIYHALGRLSEAVQYRKKAVQANPGYKAYKLDYAKALILTGKTDEGIRLLRQRVRQAPDSDEAAGSILLWQLHYLPGSTQQMFFEEYRKWGETYVPTSMARTSHNNDPDPNRKLRIAYISPDFRMNVVSQSFEPFLDGHNRERFEVFGYGKIAKPDEATKRLSQKFDHFRNIQKMNLRGVLDLIEEDRIDILIEIGGHCRDTCLGILAHKPAPVQVDYGGINTSGMAQIDYRLTDRVLTPANMEQFYVEQSVCLDSGFFSHRPPRRSPLIGPLPAKQNGYVTFGSFNNSLKINPYVIELWARVLKANEKSRFLLKFRGGNDQGMRDYFLGEFERFGISRERIDIYDKFSSHFDHLKLYNQVDIVLDTYPFNGCITTIEGLWMGVPTISLFGDDLLVSRAGLSIFTQLGLDIFAASDADEYVAKANDFAKELDNLAKIRAALRDLMLGSNLCNPKKYAQSLEKAYRMMWRRWCESQAPGPGFSKHRPEVRSCDNYATNNRNGSEKGLSEILSVENGQLKLNLPEESLSRFRESLPEFIVRANEAVQNEQWDRAKELLTDEAIDSVRLTPPDAPFRPVITFILAGLLHRTGPLDKAEELYKEVLKDEPGNKTVLLQLASVCHDAGRFTDAARYRSQASREDPDDVNVLADYALDTIRTGQVQRGIEILKTAIEKAPEDRKIRSDYLWTMHYLPDFDERKFFDEHRKWAQIHAPAGLACRDHDNDPDPKRRLKIGYISSHLCSSISTASLYAALAERDRSAVELYGYCNDPHRDDSAKNVERNFDHFRSIRRMSDREVVERILDDEIDILVNFGGGHEVINRFGVMVYKPAPVQVDYGSINTTGLEQIDYRLTDGTLSPAHLRRFYVEKSVCLESGFFTYRPPDKNPAVGPLPAREKGYVTFGSFNHNCKMNQRLLELWANILLKTENSHLILKFQGGNDRGIQDYYLSIFREFGISQDRIRFYGILPSHFDHLQLYHQIDIALDTFPFNGCTTTLECLWMGVPPISLVGEKSQLSRAGLSILSSAGLEIFAASTPDEYVCKAIAFTRELDNLEKLRPNLRRMMLGSDLCNPRKYAQSLEKAYRWMWHRWCRKQGVDVPCEKFDFHSGRTEQKSDQMPVSIADRPKQ